VVSAMGGLVDIVIDDGSHINKHVINAFKILFPKLSSGGLYVIEDTETSYWHGKGGSSGDLNSLNTTMGFFKSLIDCLNYEEFEIVNYSPTYYDLHIVSIHFYHSLIFLEKGLNREGSPWKIPINSPPSEIAR
jgi:demethylmacrocin O-methyltransferase